MNARLVRILVSIFLLYHLAAILLMPISSSLVGRKLSHFFLPYVNTLSINTAWQFFSPGPSSMFYIEYEPEFGKDDIENSQPIPYPPVRKDLSWDDGWTRRLFGMRFMAMTPGCFERYFVPYLCKTHKGALSVDVRSVFERVEDIERPGEWTEFKELYSRTDLPRQRYSCDSPPELSGEGSK